MSVINSYCKTTGLVLSILFGVVIFVISYFLAIPAVTALTWTFLGTGILALIIGVVWSIVAETSDSNTLKQCLCRNSVSLAAGIAGAPLFAVLSLALSGGATVIFANIAFAVSAFFAAFAIATLICMILCAADCDCRC